jgi:HEAT repeat protein
MTPMHEPGTMNRMSGDAIQVLVAALADVVIEADRGKAALVMAQLTGLNGHGWLHLDELSRRPYWSWRQSELDNVADWEPVLTAEISLAGLVAASMCRDGHVREAAVNILGRAQTPLAAAALAVRVADWVPDVRSAAWAAVSGRTGGDDAAAVVPIMLALNPRARGREAAASYLAEIADGPAVTIQALAVAGDRACELWALEALKHRSLLTADVLVNRAMHDPDPIVALWCARSLADPSGELSAAVGQRLLASTRARVRAFAARHLSDDQLTRQALQELLLDRSASVRSVARWRWRRQEGDPGPVYRSALADAGQPSQIAAALLGLDEERDDALPAVAVPFLTHQSPRVRRAAAQAIGHHGDARVILEYLAPLLGDSSGKVAAVALRHLHGYTLPVSVLASLNAAGTASSRRIALSVQQHSGTWSRVHADLAAINGHDRDLADAARTDLLAWLQHGAATSYGQPDADQADEIARFLATSKLSDRQRREVAFVVGLRGPVSSSQPD